MKVRFLGLLAATLVMLMLSSQAAFANKSYSFDVTDNPAGNDGAARIWGNVVFKDWNTFGWSYYLKDVCPGDGHDVSSKIQYYGDKVWAPNETTDLFNYGRGSVGNGCGTAKRVTTSSYTLPNASWNALYRARVCVRVNNGGAWTCTAWFDNPYSNDPSRTGA
jgi:hypothetical protein